MSRRILVADDSSTIQKVIKIAFARYAIEIVEAGSFVEALGAIGRAAPDALIIDASLPGIRSPDDFVRLVSDSRGRPTLLLVGTYEAVDEAALQRAGFSHFLKKPFESQDIVSMVDRLLGGELAGTRTDSQPAPQPHNAPGPLMPPLPGSGNRAQHATIIQRGGYDTLANPSFSPPQPRGHEPAEPLDDTQTPGLSTAWGQEAPRFQINDEPLPPPPTDHSRKGRKAYDYDQDQGRFGGPGDERMASPPMNFPMPEGDEPDPEPTLAGRPRHEPQHGGPSPLPQMPPAAGTSSGRKPQPTPYAPPPQSRGGVEPPPYESERLGRFERQSHQEEPMSMSNEPAWMKDGPGTPKAQKSAFGTFLGPDLTQGQGAEMTQAVTAQIMDLIGAQLPVLVRQAVEDYCDRHFKALAKEVIAAELRRLADEKARHLVDR